MSERTGLRYGLLGLIVIALLAALAYFVARPTQTPAAAHAAASPSRRRSIASWTSRNGRPPKAPRCCSSRPMNCRCSTCA